MSGGMPRPGPVVARLLLINLVVFFLGILFQDSLMQWFAVVPVRWWELWRYLTFQFLHAGLLHIMFNMIGLYFLGMLLEAGWGSRKFLIFYLACGAVAGVAHVVMAFAMHRGYGTFLIGASGGVYAVVLACAVFYPQVRVIVFLFLMPIRVAAALFLGVAAYYTLKEIFSPDMMRGSVSHVAHLGGAAAAAVWILISLGMSRRLRRGESAGRGRWERKLKQQRRQQEEIDGILDKIARDGLSSLNRHEKRVLREATQKQQTEDDLP
jgi:membrane associated rhomboid family serine protease